MAAFDPKLHEIDPVTGYQVHQDTGHPVGLIARMPAAPVNADPAWPAWVVPHESHIVRKKTEGAPDHVSTPGWEQYHVDRVSGQVTVLAMNEDEAKRAEGEFHDEPQADTGDDVDPRILRQVRTEFERAAAAQAIAESQKLAEEQALAEVEEARRRTKAKRDLDAQASEAADKAAANARARLNEHYGDAFLANQGLARPVTVPSAVAPVLGDQPQTVDIGASGSAYAGMQAKASTERAERMWADTNASNARGDDPVSVHQFDGSKEMIDADHGKIIPADDANKNKD